MGRFIPRPPRAIGDVGEVPLATLILRRQPLTTRARGIATAQMTCDYSVLSDLVLGFPPPVTDHRIMLDVEFVLGLALLS